MPPTNTSPDTAIVITTLPFTHTLDATGAPNDLVHIPTCVGSARMSVWYKYTAIATDIIFFLGTEETLVSNPETDIRLQVWVPDSAGGIKKLTVGMGNTIDYCLGLQSGEPEGPYYCRIGTNPGETYYFQLVNGDGVDILDCLIRVTALLPPNTVAPVGSFIVQDDEDGFPAPIINRVTGEFHRYIRFPAGEWTDSIIGKGYCTADGQNHFGIALYDTNFVRYAARSWEPAIVQVIRTNFVDAYYVVTRLASVNTINKISPLDASILDTWVLPAPFNANQSRSVIVTRDGTKAYCTAGQVIRTYNMVTRLQEADLVTIVNPEVFLAASEGYFDINGNLILVKNNSTTHTVRVVGYSQAGVEIFSHPLTGLFSGNHSCHVSDVPNEILVWGWLPRDANNPDTFNGNFRTYNLDTGVKVHEVTGIGIMGTSNLSPKPGNPHGVSNSCPVFVTVSGPPPAPPADLSGIYYANPNKLARHDTYYTAEKKIPDPTIKTALLGD